jgi:cell division ATPase FtsA
MNLIAIDFGSERTKLAYMDPSTGRPDLLRIGVRDDPYWPSLFHISANGDISVGDDAEEELKKDPKGIIDSLKRQLRSKTIRRNGKSRTPGKLLVALFSKLREEAEQDVPGFDTKAETTLVLTHPAACGPEYERILKKAATDSGFNQVTLISEPVAAAWYWSFRLGKTEDHVVVLDCGGGTVDWAFLTNKGGELLEEDSDFPAGNKQIGGRDIDDELLKQATGILQDREDKEAHKYVKKSPRDYRNRIRRLKERFNRTGHEQKLRITKNTHLSLKAEQFSRIARETFTQQALAEFQSYLQPIKEKIGKNPSILLVGGSANLKGLKEQVELETKCTVVKLDRRDYAPVIGAIRFVLFEVEKFLKQPTPTSSTSLPIAGHHDWGSNVHYVDAAQPAANKKTRKELLQEMTKGQLKGLGDSLNVKLSHVITHGGMMNVLLQNPKVTKEKIAAIHDDRSGRYRLLGTAVHHDEIDPVDQTTLESQQGYPAPSKDTIDYLEELRTQGEHTTSTGMAKETKENIVRGIGIALRLLFMGRP